MPRRLPGRNKIRNQILAWQNQSERTRPKLVREPNGQCIWSRQAAGAIGYQEDGQSVDHSGAVLLLRKFWHKPGIESGRTKSIHGFRGQRDQLSGGEKLGGWLKSLGSSEEPGSSSFQFAVERVLSLLTTKGR